MMSYNTMRFGTDTFNIIEDSRTALLIAKNPIVTNFEHTHIDKFIIDYDLPADTDIRFFLANHYGLCFKYTYEYGSGMFSKHFSTGDGEEDFSNWSIFVESLKPSAEDVLEHGNTVAELLAVKDVAVSSSTSGATYEFSGNLYPVIALKTTKTAVPKVKFSIQFSKRTTELDKENTLTCTYDDPIKVVTFEHEKEITGSAGATVTAACKTQADGEWSAFDALTSITDKPIYAMQLKWQMHVDHIDSDKVVSKLRWYATNDFQCNAFGDFADIYSITKNFYLPLKHCAVIVKHSNLAGGAKIKAFAKFDPSINWKAYTIGTGTGSEQTYDLPVSKFIDLSNLHVYINGVETTSNYSLWVKDNKITITAPAGAAITASSNYNLQTEQWLELDADPTQYDVSDGRYTTRYYSKITKSGVYVSAIRLRLLRPPRNFGKELILPLTPTGEEQIYRYPSNVADVSLRVLDSSGNIITNIGTIAPDGSYVSNVSLDYEYQFFPSTHALKFTVPAGNYTLQTFYTEKEDVPIVYSFTAGYCL